MNRRKTNKIARVLAHAFLEWILLSLLLLNSFFSYMIRRYADYFGLKRPCLLCSRVDHVFDREKKQNWFDLLCDGHAMEISKMGFCYGHRELVGSKDLCVDCSSSGEFSTKLGYFPWMKKIGLLRGGSGEETIGNGEMSSTKFCSCCGVRIESIISEFSQKIISNEGEEETIHPRISEFSQKQISIEEEDFPNQVFLSEFSQKTSSIQDEGFNKEAQISDSVLEVSSRENKSENYKEAADNVNTLKENFIQEGKFDDGFPSDHLEKQQKKKETREIQTEVGEMSEEDAEEEEEEEEEFSCFISSLDCQKETEDDKKQDQEVGLVIEEEQKETDTNGSVVVNHLEFYIDQQDCHLIPVEFYRSSGEDEPQGLSENSGDLVMDFVDQADFVLESNQFFEETAIILSSDDQKQKDNSGMFEITELDMNEDREETNFEAVQVQASSDDDEILQMPDDDEADAEISIGTEIPDQEQIDEHILIQQFASQADNTGSDLVEETLEFMTFPTEPQKPVLNIKQTAEEGFLEMPRRSFCVERKDSGMEDSLDSSSVTSEIECPDGVLTMEMLKSELIKERKALTALYVELEEERNASAVAANQTLSMINRLQEEKAAMQMEALQYQRLMEEQSEFDQEALHLLNELLSKREKENAELEKDLELYRKKVQEYESNEKVGILRRTRRNSSGSWTDQETEEVQKDKDWGLSEQDNGKKHTSTPTDAILGLDDTLSDFEEERFSILERLKALEQKLFNLEIDGEEDEKELENGNGYARENGNGNGHCHSNVLRSKRLLPLFDQVDGEPQDGILNGTHHENSVEDSEKSSLGDFERRTAIEEELDELYIRLQVLEGDGEFLRHCIRSLNKGDKGVCLLQQILRNLQDLRNAEIRIGNSKDYAS